MSTVAFIFVEAAVAFELKKHSFECFGCNLSVEREAKKCPKWCEDCREARVRLAGIAAHNDNYPRKLCAACGTHMSNLEYGKARFCSECNLVKVRRHDGYADPYSKTPRVAANDNSPTIKVCTACECALPLSSFHTQKTGGMGLFSECKDCRSILRGGDARKAEYARKRERLLTPEVIEAKKQATFRKLRERLAVKWYLLKRKEKRQIGREISAYIRQFKAREASLVRAAEDDLRMSEKVAARPWLASGLTPYQRQRIRAENDNDFAVNVRLQRRLLDQTRLRKRGRCGHAAKAVRSAIRGAGNLPKFLGYTASDLRIHLESLFVDGMTWDAFHRGEIHLDHKRPLSHFDLTDDDQVKMAWAMDNLQPLWAPDNMAKGATTDEEWRRSRLSA